MQNFIKMIINSVQIWTKKEIKNSTADWNQNDSSADNYVKNRTHWEDEDGTIHKLDSKYLDLPDNLATTDDVQEAVGAATNAQNTANTALTNANTAQNTANTKMDATNPVGTGSFSMNRKSGSIIGQNSVSMGENTIMSLNNGFASGKYNNEPYVENVTSIRSNSKYNYFSQDGCVYFYSSEYTFSSETGMYSLVNAIETTGTAMKNNYIDIKNMYFIEKAPESTTMRYVKNIVYRDLYTYGIIDGDLYTSDKKSYAHIVGNGTSDAERSNAHTLDWNGVGWYKGGLQVGGNAQDNGAKNVLLEGDALKLDEVQINLPVEDDWTSIAYGNGKFVAVAGNVFSETNKVAYSKDGINWMYTILPTEGYCLVTYGNGKFVVAAGATSKNASSAYSEDGINWTKVDLPFASTCRIVYGNGKFIIASYDTKKSVYSEDGMNWTEVDFPDYHCNSMTYGDGKFISMHRGYAYSSEDGITWTRLSLPTGIRWQNVAYGNGIFVIASNDANTNTNDSIAYSEDGINWTSRTTPCNYLDSLVFVNGKFVINNEGTPYSSEDGVTWTQLHLPTGTGDWQIVYGNDKFIAIKRDSNLVYYSEDCVNWHNVCKCFVQDNEDITEEVRDFILNGSVITSPKTATVGQILAVKAVDENGKPTEWGLVTIGLGTDENGVMTITMTE